MQKTCQDAQVNFEKNPCVETRKVLEEYKIDLERFYDKKTKGIIVRSRQDGMSMEKKVISIF